jgi:hypothetical protein
MGAWKSRVGAALGALTLLAGPSAAAQVPDPFARELAQKLARAELSETGYMRAAGPFAGGLARGENRRIPLSLRAGQSYRIVGVCADRCEASVRLSDQNDAPVANGVIEEGASVMIVRPAFTGAYNVEVEITRCAALSCWYAVNVYSR